MRVILISLVTITLFGSCKTKKSDNEQTEMSRPIKEQPQSSVTTKKGQYDLAVSYEALSRGAFEYILVSENVVLTSKDRSLKNIQSHQCSSKDWNDISKLIKSVDRELIPKLIPPTDKRLYDGAPHATISFIYGDVEIRSPSFDHGFPPKEIENLVSKILSIKETVSNP